MNGHDHNQADRPPRTHLFDKDGSAVGAFTIQRGDRIEIRGEDGTTSTTVQVDDIDDGPGGSFAFTVSEVSS